MKDIDLLEYGSPFGLKVDGELLQLQDPGSMHYQAVLSCLAVGLAPGTPDVALWKRKLIFERWCAAYDLPVFQDAQRLAYLVDHYRSAISYDLLTYANQDLGALWRKRRWRTLLDILDHLPSHSWYSATVSMDPEHAKMVAASIAARKEAGEDTKAAGPHLTTWTPEASLLTSLIDAVRNVFYTVAVTNGAKTEAPQPAPRPQSQLEIEIKRAEYQRKKAKHEALADRLLPNRRKPEDPVH